MAVPSQVGNPEIENKIEAMELRVSTWKLLKDEIQSLMDTLCELDDDKTKSVDIIAEHTERITSLIPSNPIDAWYPKLIHHLLSVGPLQRTEIPLEVLEVLVSSGFDVNKYHYSNGKDVNEDFCEQEDAPDEKRMSCLRLAIKNHHYSAARWLVQHGADCDKESYDELDKIDGHFTPITMLAMNQDAPLDLFNILLTQENLNRKNHRCMHLPLHFAALHGHTNIALHLIKQGASVNQEDGDGHIPLHFAVVERHTDLSLALIKHGASVNLKNGSGHLPLHLAIHNKDTGLALLLIEHGASNQEDGCRNLPLHLAVREGHTHDTDVALSLINHGALVNQEDIYGFPPAAYYVRNDTKYCNGELFTRLIPRSSMNIFKTICNIFQQDIESQEFLSWMLQQLIQRLIVIDTLNFSITFEVRGQWSPHIWVEVKLNENTLIKEIESFRPAYLCSKLLILLDCDVSFPDAIVPRWGDLSSNRQHLFTSPAQSIDELWHMYKQKHDVKNLQILCIQKTRQCMASLTDESFRCLPVPSRIRKSLMLHHVADILCEAYQMWENTYTLRI